MSVALKRKRDLLGDKVKSRIFGLQRSEPSGSEHNNEALSFPDLGDGCLVDGGDVRMVENELNFNTNLFSSLRVIEELVHNSAMDRGDPFKNQLATTVSRAVFAFSSTGGSDKSIFRRKVMALLRNCGYNAAICKTKWEGSGGITGGNFEFIDVVRPDSVRYFVELDLAGEFDIARPTKEYELMFQALPRVFVGRWEELKPIVKVMSDAAKVSLKSRGLFLPPWRKNRYMQNKWFGPNRPTANVVSASSSVFPPPAKPNYSVMCRSVGFEAGGGGLWFPAATRTR